MHDVRRLDQRAFDLFLEDESKTCAPGRILLDFEICGLDSVACFLVSLHRQEVDADRLLRVSAGYV